MIFIFTQTNKIYWYH